MLRAYVAVAFRFKKIRMCRPLAGSGSNKMLIVVVIVSQRCVGCMTSSLKCTYFCRKDGSHYDGTSFLAESGNASINTKKLFMVQNFQSKSASVLFFQEP